VPFKVETDFEYLGIVNHVPMTLISKPGIPASNYKELAGWIAANKGKINIGNAGVGSASHLCGLLFQSATKTEMTPVPYKGTAPAITDLIGGQIDLLCDQSTNTSPQIEAKKVKAYAVMSAKRLPSGPLAKLPTADESGLKGFNLAVWHGLYAPKGTPKAVIDKVNTALRAALKDADFHKRQQALGAVIVSDARLAPAEHRKFFEAEVNRWTKTFKDSGVQPE
jgi:tripartite-type tricarboxylate transporter receptor subunit TctC